MRIWKQFGSLQSGLMTSSAILALAYGAVFVQSVRSAISTGSAESPHWEFYIFTVVNGLVPLVGGIVALWRGSSTVLIAAWAFVVGLVFADVLHSLELIVAAGETLVSGKVPIALVMTFPVWVAVIGLVLVASSRLLSSRTRNTASNQGKV